MVRRGLSEKVTAFELRPEGSQEGGCAEMWGQKCIVNSVRQCPVVGASLASLRNGTRDSEPAGKRPGGSDGPCWGGNDKQGRKLGCITTEFENHQRF